MIVLIIIIAILLKLIFGAPLFLAIFLMGLGYFLGRSEK